MKSIEACESKTELQYLLENARKEIYEIELDGKVKKTSLIEHYSPLMNKRIQDMENLSLRKMKKDVVVSLSRQIKINFKSGKHPICPHYFIFSYSFATIKSTKRPLSCVEREKLR